MTNVKRTAEYIPTSIAIGLTAASKASSDWVNSTSKGFVTWGGNVISNVGKTAEGMYQNFVGGLSAAWDSFTGFMNGVGESIGGWWSANKTWAAPAAIGLAAVGVAAAVVLSGGAALPAVAALAPIGLATGGLITAPTYSLIGEGQDNEAVIPLNNSVFSSIGKGIADNSTSSGNALDTDRIVESISELKTAIRNISIALYADDRKIAESSNRGNARIARSTSPTAG